MITAPWTDRARQLAAADLCERAAVMLRSSGEDAGQPDHAAQALETAICLLCSTIAGAGTYRSGLAVLGLVGEEAEAAVAAALAGTTPHPLASPAPLFDKPEAVRELVVIGLASRDGLTHALADLLSRALPPVPTATPSEPT